MAGSRLLKEINLTITLFLFIVLIGYLEANIPGILAGIVMYGAANSLLPLSLIPFIGFFAWYYSTFSLTKCISEFIPTTVLHDSTLWVFGIQAIMYTLLTSFLTIIAIIWLVRYRKTKSRMYASALPAIPESIKKVLRTIPFDKIEDVKEKIQGLLKIMNKKIVGSALFWFGVGVASHDFQYETGESIVDTSRLTHGVYVGLSIASGGLHMIEAQKRKNMLFYTGLAICGLAFNTLSVLPKGLSRIVANFLWWCGTSLMIMNWYIHMQNELIKEEDINTLKATLIG